MQRTKLQKTHPFAQVLFAADCSPTIEVFQTCHPFIGIESRTFRKVIGHRTYFLAQENRNRTDGMLDIDAVALELLDTFCQKLVVVDKGPKVPELGIARM